MLLLMWKWMGLLLNKNYLLSIWSLKFLSPEVAIYFYKSTIRPCVECCCCFWVGAPSCCLGMLDKLQKQVCMIAGPTTAVSLEPLAHRRNVTTLSPFYRCCFSRCSFELGELVLLPYSHGRSTRYSDRLYDFLSSFLDAIRMSMPTGSFLAHLEPRILCV